MLVLPNNEKPLPDEGWEMAGKFSTNHTLYVRREFLNELPITTITFQLTELSNKGGDHNKRGPCYDGPDQVVNSTLVSDPSKLWSYDVQLPPVCHVPDLRYTLVDQVPLQDHFLQNLQLTVPLCKSFSLYPLSDPRYEAALDPDYLNSGVKCGSTPHYKCVRDPYQPTDCPAGDNICDVVINQNACGEYAHAVRSAFSSYKSNGITLGMYFTREVQWTDACNVDKYQVFNAHWNLAGVMYINSVLLFLWIVYHLHFFSSFERDDFMVVTVWDCVAYAFMLVLLFVMVLFISKVCNIGTLVELFADHLLVPPCLIFSFLCRLWSFTTLLQVENALTSLRGD